MTGDIWREETGETGSDRCRCGTVAMSGSDWCKSCLRGANPRPVQMTPRLAASQARDCAEIAARARQRGDEDIAVWYEREAARLRHLAHRSVA